jgi:hypothetical protein
MVGRHCGEIDVGDAGHSDFVVQTTRKPGAKRPDTRSDGPDGFRVVYITKRVSSRSPQLRASDPKWMAGNSTG